MSRKSKMSAVIEHKESESEARPTVTVHTDRDTGKLSPHDLVTHITKSAIVFQNYPYTGAKQAFPGQPLMYTCERYYPKAEGGPIYVDEPQFATDWKECEMKREVMKANGFRYLIMGKRPDGSFVDTIDAMEQLGIA